MNKAIINYKKVTRRWVKTHPTKLFERKKKENEQAKNRQLVFKSL